jgi:hypothetical protein
VTIQIIKKKKYQKMLIRVELKKIIMNQKINLIKIQIIIIVLFTKTTKTSAKTIIILAPTMILIT